LTVAPSDAKHKCPVLQAATHMPKQPGAHLPPARDPRGALWRLVRPKPPTGADKCAIAQQSLAQFPTGFRLQLTFAGMAYTPQLQEWLHEHGQRVQLTVMKLRSSPIKKALARKNARAADARSTPGRTAQRPSARTS